VSKDVYPVAESMAKTLPKCRLALQIIFILLYFPSVKLTFSAPFGEQFCLRKIVRNV
jgi:cellulose synthase/poly-beta-1,6-N-acetylglucosamine synthase-like glycosyltransferase